MTFSKAIFLGLGLGIVTGLFFGDLLVLWAMSLVNDEGRIRVESQLVNP